MRSTTDLLEEVQKMLVALDQAHYESLPVYMVGSDELVDVKAWLAKFADVLKEAEGISPNVTDYRSICPTSASRPLVSIITSLYQGGEYLESFLKNITSQTIFRDDCELIIINVLPLHKEIELIKQYQERFNNIQSIEMWERIGIYQAWNLAIERSAGEFITNANVDDIRRQDCLEVQAKHLLEKPDIGVVYSDVFYTFFPNLPFEFAARCDFKTSLPTANKFNLLKYNSPHNAPMWRRSIHRQVGQFDTSFRSAGDHDFWIRAALEEIKFYKIEDTLISYFFNPKGMSTQKDSPGKIEGEKVVDFYKTIYSKQFFFSTSNEKSIFIPTELFLTALGSFETDFAITDRHIFYGPYIKLPIGLYRAVFCFSIEGLGDQPIVSPISFDIAQSQAEMCGRGFGEAEREQITKGRAELIFTNFDPEAAIEFRTHTAGKPFEGKFRFQGVELEKVAEGLAATS